MHFKGCRLLNSIEKSIQDYSFCFQLHISEDLKIIANKAFHAKRNFVNIFDSLKTKNKLFLNKVDFSESTTLLENKLKYVENSAESSWKSPIGVSNKNIIHIYDFMPELPPIQKN